MQKLKIRQGDGVIVCDGKKALVLDTAADPFAKRISRPNSRSVR